MSVPMFKLSIRPQWHIERLDGRTMPSSLIDLLDAVQRTGSLAEACRSRGVSYRHAWGLLKEGGGLFGMPLVNMERGRGAQLTPLAEKLVWADRRVAARLTPLFDSLASELEAELQRALLDSRAILRIQASHGFAVQAMRSGLTSAQVAVDLKYRSSFESVAALFHGDCDIAGFHVPIGRFRDAALAQYARWLDPGRQRLVHLATRTQGLMVARGNPKQIQGWADLGRAEVRFVNRQPGSGTRLLLDALIEEAGIDPRDIPGFENAEFTHAAVAAYVASGMADVGFGLHAAAAQFSLDFLPITRERYVLLCDQEVFGSGRLKPLLELLRSAEFQRSVDALPGYDATQCGAEATLEAAFA